jgi:RNA polymerase sigma factor (sigma-70 family)
MTVGADEQADIGEEPSDAELLTAVRAGNEDAYGQLWTRHSGPARRLAAQLTRSGNVDDLVSEAFLRVFRAIMAGGGPDAAFRPYLLSTMRRINIDLGRSYHQRVTLTGEAADLETEPAEPAEETYALQAEQQAAWRAWESLPEDTRALLWHLVVEEETPAQIAPVLGVSPNGVSSRAVRAKERLRQAFLAQHLSSTDDETCRAVRAKLGGYVRNALSARDRDAVDEHLRDCSHCAAAVFEIGDVNATLRGVIVPILLGGPAIAARYLAASHHVVAGGAFGVGWLVRLVGQARKAPAITAGAAGAVIVGAAVSAAALAGGGHPAQHPRTRPPALAQVVPPAPTTHTPAPAHVTPARPAATRRPTARTTPSRPTRSPTRTPAVTPTPGVTPTPAPTPHRTASRSTSPSRRPTPQPPVDRPTTIALAIPGGPTGLRLHIQLPAGWRVVSVTADGPLVSGSGTDQSDWWYAYASHVTVAVTGHGAAHAFATLTTMTARGSNTQHYPLR